MMYLLLKSTVMKLRILSDLHLEADRSYRPNVMENEKSQTLILAGDICELQRTSILNPFVEEMAERFGNIIYVPGNHEYYSGHIPHSLQKAKERYSGLSNVNILSDEFVDIDGVRVVGSTLWTDFNKNDPLAMFHAGFSMNDYRKIRVSNYRKIKPIETVGMHAKSVIFLHEALSAATGKKIVVTHHGPSWKSIHPSYAGDSLNPAYVSDLSELIYQTVPDLWFHGHVHNSFDYMVYDTRVICNPKGYSSIRMGAENKLFDSELMLEI